MENSPQFKKQEEGVGPLVGIIIIVVLMIVGGTYFLVTEEFNKTPAAPAPTASTTQQ